MARGDERRSKHRQDVGASSSGLSTKSKKLAKRPRPSSYQEKRVISISVFYSMWLVIWTRIFLMHGL
jgi:hypothetical protein